MEENLAEREKRWVEPEAIYKIELSVLSFKKFIKYCLYYRFYISKFLSAKLRVLRVQSEAKEVDM